MLFLFTTVFNTQALRLHRSQADQASSSVQQFLSIIAAAQRPPMLESRSPREIYRRDINSLQLSHHLLIISTRAKVIMNLAQTAEEMSNKFDARKRRFPVCKLIVWLAQAMTQRISTLFLSLAVVFGLRRSRDDDGEIICSFSRLDE